MSGLHSSLLYSDTRFRSPNSRDYGSIQSVPTQNRLLAALPVEAYQRLQPDLVPVHFPAGQTFHDTNFRQEHLYFPTAGIVSRFCVIENETSTATSVTGSEGVIGFAQILGGGSATSKAVALTAGYAYRLRVDHLNDEITRNGPLLRLLLRHTQALIVQTGQTAVCNRHHRLEQQLCRWILLCLDRSDSNELTLTQELIARMLGARRESVTEAAGRLKAAGLIHYSRGQVSGLDRLRLENRACECYAVVKREYDRLLPVEESNPRGHRRLAPAVASGDGCLAVC